MCMAPNFFKFDIIEGNCGFAREKPMSVFIEKRLFLAYLDFFLVAGTLIPGKIQ